MKRTLEFRTRRYYQSDSQGTGCHVCVVGALMKSCGMDASKLEKQNEYGRSVNGYGILSPELSKVAIPMTQKLGINNEDLSQMQHFNDQKKWSELTNLLRELGLYDRVSAHAKPERRP